jgi:transcriptional regulator with XRE-family HTH domain
MAKSIHRLLASVSGGRFNNVEQQWSDYVRRVAGSLTQAEIAKKAGVATSNVGRWLRGEPGQPKAENVIAFTEAFNRDPIEGLYAAGYLTSKWIRNVRTPLGEYSTDDLMKELKRRTQRP